MQKTAIRSFGAFVSLIIVTLLAVLAFSGAAYAAATGSVQVNEVVVGGSANASDFTVTLKSSDGSNSVSISASGGTMLFTSLMPGIYTISQTGPSGYTTVFSGGCDSKGKVTVLPGSTVNCTITNTSRGTVPGGGGSGGSGGTGGSGGGGGSSGGGHQLGFERPVINRPGR